MRIHRNRSNRKSAGLGLLEFVVSMLIAAPLLTLFLLTLANSSRAVFQITAQEAGIYNYAKVRALLQNLTDDYSAHTLLIEPRIHDQGVITFSDGAANSIHQAALKMQPAQSSDAVSALALDLRGSLRIFRAEKSGNTFRYFACLSLKDSGTIESPASFLALTVDGLLELHGELQSIRGRSGCFALTLRTGPSMTIPINKSLRPEFSRLLVPISKNYTLYVSRQGELRFLSHRGGENIENQPLLTGIEQLTLSLRKPAVRGIFALSGQLEAPPKVKRSFSFPCLIGRDDFLNLLLNSF